MTQQCRLLPLDNLSKRAAKDETKAEKKAADAKTQRRSPEASLRTCGAQQQQQTNPSASSAACRRRTSDIEVLVQNEEGDAEEIQRQKTLHGNRAGGQKCRRQSIADRITRRRNSEVARRHHHNGMSAAHRRREFAQLIDEHRAIVRELDQHQQQQQTRNKPSQKPMVPAIHECNDKENQQEEVKNFSWDFLAPAVAASPGDRSVRDTHFGSLRSVPPVEEASRSSRRCRCFASLARQLRSRFVDLQRLENGKDGQRLLHCGWALQNIDRGHSSSRSRWSRGWAPHRMQQPGTECGPLRQLRPSPISGSSGGAFLADAGGSAQRFPGAAAEIARHRNTDIRDGKCRIVLPVQDTMLHCRRKKLNSIDGFVLCNTCMLKRAQRRRRRSNHRSLNEPRFRKEGRRPLRQILYPDDPEKPITIAPDYRFEPPPYLAVDRNIGPQACPSCQQQALSPGAGGPWHSQSLPRESLPVRGLSESDALRLRSYRMYSLKGCSCPTKRRWCGAPRWPVGRPDCCTTAEANCQLEPLHPGGRPKRDVPGILPDLIPKI
uniref:Uncharacterized protein n=1 Tax=Macrostomum lignano TaxID=282301 RepID=A0A1I8FA20_9PLAT